MDEKLLTDFALLFGGRGDVYGSETGSCVKDPITIDVLRRHFTTEPIGVYPLMLSGKVVWGCVDFDTIESRNHAIALYDALSHADVVSWIEKSRSKGYHVWVFASEPVAAADMRNMLMVASQVANTPTTEVNPKQTVYNPNGYGNYVRLPYAHLGDNTCRQRIIKRDEMSTGDVTIPLEEFVDYALSTRVSVELIRSLAAMYVPPAPAHVVPLGGIIEHDATLSESMAVLSSLGKVIWRDGPLPGKDRSTTLTKLGYECVRSGLNMSQTKVVLTVADKRWGKYYLRADGELEIDKLVVRVHS